MEIFLVEHVFWLLEFDICYVTHLARFLCPTLAEEREMIFD